MLVQHTPNAWVYTLLICGVGSIPFTLAQNNCSPPPAQQCGCTYIVLVSTLYMLTILINIFLTSWWNSWVWEVGGRGDRKGFWWILTSIHALQSNSENCVRLKYACNVYYVMTSCERDLQPQKWHKTDVFQSKYLLSVCISSHIQYLVWGILGNKNPTNAYSHSSEATVNFGGSTDLIIIFG